eukprot:CAMPEP_0113935906 /NCGR_PEP_ID=MMETSP1339-20121228/2935_1 /TAXON_ID=94617 /ORGANISM="Fibrocapsa japonica" /LENGTH=337 /DNA_ID=CAMNT_0000938199 /DNA_START=363 /DNA_END=1376 /DNA_ORIENTATION=+ /assembly_acc=CAM_ASM_000762
MSGVASPTPSELWGLGPCPQDPNLTLACMSTEGKFSATVLKLGTPGEDGGGGEVETEEDREATPGRRGSGTLHAPVEELASLPAPDGYLRCMQWGEESAGSSDKAVTLDASTLRVWALDPAGASVQEEVSIPAVGGPAPIQACTAGSWDPHHQHSFLAAHNTTIEGWDFRSPQKSVLCVHGAHRYGICDLDHNPNRPHFVASCGKDRLLKFWDLRKPDAPTTSDPVKTLAGHTHWTCRAQYNRFHDQLVLSGGTDGRVNLWRVSSISSAPLLLELEGDTSSKSDAADAKIRSFDEHEESVYSVAWSGCDAWVFASLSYDGRVILNHVPSTEKYKILL